MPSVAGIRVSRFFFGLSLLLTILWSLSLTGAVPSHTASDLKTGMHWTLSGNTTYTAAGTGIYSGSCAQQAWWVEKFEIERVEGNSIHLIRSYSRNWTIALYGWFQRWWGASDRQGSYFSLDRYTINRTTSKYLEAPANQLWWVNKTAGFIINPTGLEPRSQVPEVWWNESGVPEEVMYDTRDSQARVFDLNVAAWQVSHTGGTIGWTLGKEFIEGEHLVGIETETLIFDKELGILLGSSGEGEYQFQSSSGGIEETYREDSSLVESNIWAVISFDAEPRTASISVDGIAYGPEELPKRLLWVNGSYHSFSVKPVVPAGARARWVFVGWHDGTGNSSITVGATANENYRAIYETQYLLTVVSEHDAPHGSGWYVKGSVASFSVSPRVSAEGLLGVLGGEYAFIRWIGDSNAIAENASVVIDGAKTVAAEWRLEYTAVYRTIAFMVAAVIGCLGLALERRRKRKRPPISDSTRKKASGAEYGRFLARLDQLRDGQEITETTYQRLKKEYRQKQRS